MKLLSQPSPELDHWFREVFDTDVFLRSETINTLLGNIDGYSSQGNNYFLFSDRDTADTVFVPLDFDRAFF